MMVCGRRDVILERSVCVCYYYDNNTHGVRSMCKNEIFIFQVSRYIFFPYFLKYYFKYHAGMSALSKHLTIISYLKFNRVVVETICVRFIFQVHVWHFVFLFFLSVFLHLCEYIQDVRILILLSSSFKN